MVTCSVLLDWHPREGSFPQSVSEQILCQGVLHKFSEPKHENQVVAINTSFRSVKGFFLCIGTCSLVT